MAFKKEEWQLPAPYGSLGGMIAGITFVAWIIFVISAFNCWLTVSNQGDTKVFIGYWSREMTDFAPGSEDKNVCVPWSGTEWFDGVWKFGKAVGVMGAIIGGILMLLGIYIIFRRIEFSLFKIVVFPLHLVMAVMSLLLLVGLGSDVCDNAECKFGPGSALAIISFILWAVTAWLVFSLHTKGEEGDDDDGNDQPQSGPTSSALVPYEDEPTPAQKKKKPSTAMVPYNEDDEGEPPKKKKPAKKKDTKNNQMVLSNNV